MDNLLSHKNSGDPIIVKVKDIDIGREKKVVISGPCAVEDYDTMILLAKKLKSCGVNILRGGAFKPRTSPYDFQGLEEKGLEILKAVREEVNIPISTEIMDPRDIEKSLEYIDVIQVGSRNMYNYSLLKEIGRLKTPVILKRGISATIKEWLYAAEYILSGGNENVIFCERGIRTFEPYTRNTLDLNAVAFIKNNYRLPIIVDPSHGTGVRELVYPMSLASIAAGADGLIIESHLNPDKSISDAKQTISVDTLCDIINKIK
ncbi:3-deoxy-7-phosphoheptulonate synthase [Clostridium amazonitimonense]|uniref:3-deoxy-7-phosphoheptulonate synthase n=1 Tax=Clostridium amazonitimonense TaxID=1499689 RepID=UPI0005095FA7|nr:3-deoxy-7-phosphoheptulonate synthase [Clostridium amazonitimonense]